ncbi:MAG: hypothetical protein QM599_01790 [Pseudoxanthomonas sp.]
MLTGRLVASRPVEVVIESAPHCAKRAPGADIHFMLCNQAVTIDLRISADEAREVACALISTANEVDCMPGQEGR